MYIHRWERIQEKLNRESPLSYESVKIKLMLNNDNKQ